MQQAPSNIYNTFHGYAAEVKNIKKDNIEESLIIKHIKNLCNNDEAVYKYVIHFLARKLQKPNILTYLITDFARMKKQSTLNVVVPHASIFHEDICIIYLKPRKFQGYKH